MTRPTPTTGPAAGAVAGSPSLNQPTRTLAEAQADVRHKQIAILRKMLEHEKRLVAVYAARRGAETIQIMHDDQAWALTAAIQAMGGE